MSEAERQVQHPLRWPQFYRECFRYATTGVLGVVGDVSTVSAIVSLGVHRFAPRSYEDAAEYLQKRGLDDLLVLAVSVGALILLGRLLMAPFILYRDKPSVARRGDVDTRREIASELAILAGSLGQFIAARDAAFDLQFGAPRTAMEEVRDQMDFLTASGEREKREHKTNAMRVRFQAATLQEYGAEFGARILQTAGRLSEFGVDSNVIAQLGRYPATLADLRAIVPSLEAASCRVRQDAKGDGGAITENSD